MRTMARFTLVLALAASALAGCTTAPDSPETRTALVQQATATMQDMVRMDASVDSVVRSGYGYAIFPEVVKAGLGLGGGYGQGVVYEQGQHIGFADLTMGSIGAQIGGQAFREVIVFQNKAAMDRFKLSPVDFTAGAAAMIMHNGAAANAEFIQGVAVLIQPITGAMAEATIGGQQFKFVPR